MKSIKKFWNWVLQLLRRNEQEKEQEPKEVLESIVEEIVEAMAAESAEAPELVHKYQRKTAAKGILGRRKRST